MNSYVRKCPSCIKPALHPMLKCAPFVNTISSTVNIIIPDAQNWIHLKSIYFSVWNLNGK